MRSCQPEWHDDERTEEEQDARRETARLDLETLDAALKLFHVKHGRYPTAQEGLGALVKEDLLEELREDPWSTPYAYRVEGGRWRVVSYGEDGVPGGEGHDEDLTAGTLAP